MEGMKMRVILKILRQSSNRGCVTTLFHIVCLPSPKGQMVLTWSLEEEDANVVQPPTNTSFTVIAH